MSLARLGHSGGGAAKGNLTTKNLSESPATDAAGNTITKFGENTTNLPATYGGATGRKNPKRPEGGIAKFKDVLEPGGQENP